ncbi:High choriolytic enzyme 1 [Camponotus floridanus]|uniref:Metalloendopeptidase n=1 Tax=Camponotus floridanus TaxID=104421 RepID=E1ZW81_CAMFO|nr:High choriolytic enzyme 1 [Camponotus floridanus]
MSYDNNILYTVDKWSQYDNPEESAEQAEGDIHVSRKSRKTITTNKALLWTNGVVNYYVHSSIVNEPTKLAMLESALQTIMSKTCIKFVRIQEYEKLPANNWINITGHQKGCFSNLGRNAYRPTNLNLNVDGCFYLIGHPIHEILHALGVNHEHMRPDRDKYVTIIWENIEKGQEYNFHNLNKNIATAYGFPYDYDSVMHYSMTAFSINRSSPTIIPTASPVEIGQRDHISYYDIQKLLIAYNCSSMDTKNKSILETEVKPQISQRMFTTYNSKSNKLEKNRKYPKSEKSMNRYNQVTFPRSIHHNQPYNYPVPLCVNPIYLYVDFHFYFKK